MLQEPVPLQVTVPCTTTYNVIGNSLPDNEYALL